MLEFFSKYAYVTRVAVDFNEEGMQIHVYLPHFFIRGIT